jgi:hypothetical protein
VLIYVNVYLRDDMLSLVPRYTNLTANCIIIAPKRLKLRLPGSARKSQKRFRDTPMFKFQAVLSRTQPFYHAA